MEQYPHRSGHGPAADVKYAIAFSFLLSTAYRHVPTSTHMRFAALKTCLQRHMPRVLHAANLQCSNFFEHQEILVSKKQGSEPD